MCSEKVVTTQHDLDYRNVVNSTRHVPLLYVTETALTDWLFVRFSVDMFRTPQRTPRGYTVVKDVCRLLEWFCLWFSSLDQYFYSYNKVSWTTVYLQELLGFKIPFETLHWQVQDAEFKIACTYLIPCNLYSSLVCSWILQQDTLSLLFSVLLAFVSHQNVVLLAHAVVELANCQKMHIITKEKCFKYKFWELLIQTPVLNISHI